MHGLYSNGTRDLMSRKKPSKFSSFLENIQFLYVSADYDTINNSGGYFTCRVCNLENLVTKL